MRTLLAIAFLLVSLHAQAATLASARLKVDTWLTNQWPTVTSKQDAYFAANGRYWQGLVTFSTTNNIPNYTAAADGDTAPTNTSAKPHYQAESFADFFPALVGLSIPLAFEITQYIGPLGAGYVVTCYVRFNGTIYLRTRQRGPEPWRNADWAAWTPSTL